MYEFSHGIDHVGKNGVAPISAGAATTTATATIEDVRIETKTVRVYNLEVENLHTFFVGDQGLIVHNGYTPPPSPGRPTRENTGGLFVPTQGSGHYKYWPHAKCKDYIDKFDDVWEPTTHNNTHAPHWDRQHRNGNHTPTYPVALQPLKMPGKR